MPHLSSMGNQKLYRIVIDVQYGDMLDECDKLYDGKGYGTVFTDANGEAVIDYLKQWDSDEWTDDDIRSEELIPYIKRMDTPLFTTQLLVVYICCIVKQMMLK